VIYVKKIEKTDPESDLVVKWLKNDAFHQQVGITEDQIWEPNSEVALIHDENGPVMAVRFQKALRVAIQFNPETAYRSAKVAKEVVNWFKTLAQKQKCTEIVIRPGGKAENFSEKLGFEPFNGKVMRITDVQGQ